MGKNHVKRLSMPRSWPMSRKSNRWITRPNPGAHSLATSLAIGTIVRDLLGYAKTMKEVKHILNNKEVLVNGKRVKDQRVGVGMFDSISIPEINEYHRMTVNHNGKLMIIKVPKDEVKSRILKLVGKKLHAGKTQLAFFDGTTVLIDKKNNYRIGDGIIMHEGKITEHLSLDKGATIFLTGGAHLAATGTVEAIEGDNVRFKVDHNAYITPKKYAFVLGKGKALITVK